MATIVIEDGTIVATANSYITVAELDTYASDRGVTITAATEAAKGELLIEAMDYIESLNYKGVKVNGDTSVQPLQWPRANVVIDSYLNSITSIPELLKDGQAEVALAIDNSQSPLADVDRLVQKEGMKGMFIEYATNNQATTIVRKINTKLYKLLRSNGSGFVVSR